MIMMIMMMMMMSMMVTKSCEVFFLVKTDDPPRPSGPKAWDDNKEEKIYH